MYVLLYHVIIKFFFSTVIIRSSMYHCLENTELMAAMKRNSFSVRVKDNAKYTKSGFPRHYRIINRRKKNLKRTIGGRCIAHVWIVDSSVQRLHSALFANMFTLTTSAVLRNLPVYKIMNNLKMDDLGHHVFVPHVKFWNVRTFEPNSSSARIFDYSLPFKRSQVLAPCTSSFFYPILLLIG